MSLLAEPLPEYGISVVLSTWTTPSSAETQAAENTSATATNVAQGTATVLVRTFDDRIDVAQQLLDRDGPGADAQIIPDLSAALASKIDHSAINGDGTSGSFTGLLAAGTTSITYADGTPTLAEAWPKIEQAYRSSATARGCASAPMLCILHSRRWSWIRERRAVESGLDLSLSDSPIPEAVARAGDLHLVIDDNIPTGLGAGTNEDRIVIAPRDVLVLLTSPPSIAIQSASVTSITATITGTQYAAFNAGRGIPAAVAIVGGTGLVGP